MPIPPKAARDNAQRVLDWRDKYPDEVKGMTRTGWTRANQIAKGENLSDDTVSRIAAFERHRKNSEIAEEFKGTPWKDAGYVAWLGWGGDAGIAWAQSEVKKRESNSMTQIRVNVRTLVNNAAIRQEVRNGRQVMIIPSATMPDNVVMNKCMYPAEEIAKSFHTLEGTLAPIGHPKINGVFVSAMNTHALTGEFQPFAVNENVTRQNGRVYLDKVVDIENAKASEKGRTLLAAVAAGDPIHTSTGIMLNRREEPGEGYDWVAENMSFDHDAILLNESGAATPEQGVGMMVNADGTKVEVIETFIPDDMLESMAEMLASDIQYYEQKKKSKGLAARILNAIRSVLQSDLQLTSNTKEYGTMTPEQFNQIIDAVNASKSPTVNAEDISKSVASAVAEAIKPLVDVVNSLQQEKLDQEKAEKAALVDSVVNANLMNRDVAETMTVNQLKPLAEKFGKAGLAAPIHGHFAGNHDQESYEMPE